MTLTWTDLTNGITNLLFRTNINTFNNNVKTQVNQNTGDIGTLNTSVTSIDGRVTTAEGDITALEGRMTTAEADIVAAEDRITELEGGHSLLVEASSSINQNPTGLGDVNNIQIAFDAGATSVDVNISAAGAITFNTTGKYFMRIEAHYGRVGSTGSSKLVFRYKVNGVPQTYMHTASMDNANITLPWADTNVFSMNATDTITMELMRDSSGDNSGGLVATTTDWGSVSSCRLVVYKIL